MADPSSAPLNFTLKVATRCNLNCSYCYVYNKGDETWRDRPSVMSERVFTAAIERIRDHCAASGQPTVEIAYHGGEPCLVGAQRLDVWCRRAREILDGTTKASFTIQTNGTLIDDEWLEVFRKHEILVGVSVDGPREVHDLFRVDRVGRGSYDRVAQGIHRLREGGIEVGLLSVVVFGGDGLQIHRHLAGLGAGHISYLLPHFTHDTVGPIRDCFGPTPCSDYLLPILNDWWTNGSLDEPISIFWEMSRLVLGGRSHLDLFGNQPLSFVFVETDGAIEGLDILRICEPGMAATGTNVLTHTFADIARASELHRASIFEGLALPGDCAPCREAMTCGGGHIADRYSRARGFDNRSVWCQDLLMLFGRLRELLDVTPRETAMRRSILDDMAADALRNHHG